MVLRFSSSGREKRIYRANTGHALQELLYLFDLYDFYYALEGICANIISGSSQYVTRDGSTLIFQVKMLPARRLPLIRATGYALKRGATHHVVAHRLASLRQSPKIAPPCLPD
jgi:hypothetical protein